MRFSEGKLVDFLLKLNPEQEKYVNWRINASGPTLVKGGPGTGKSTVALYRVRALLETLTLEANPTQAKIKILFITYTKALVTFSQQFLESLLSENIKYVEVKTADSVIAELLPQNTIKVVNNQEDLREIIKQARHNAIETLSDNMLLRQAKIQILERLSLDYLLDEIGSVIEAREIKTLEEYLAVPRNGRDIALNKTQRQAIWHLRLHFYQLLEEKQLETWQQRLARAMENLREMENPPIYDAVIIDEAQDLEANTLRILTQLCRSTNRLFITADTNQSIYGNSFRWSDVHQDLKFVGRTGMLRINHRNTREINEAAISYLNNGILNNNSGEQEYIHNGVQPAVFTINSAAQEGELLMRFCKTATSKLRLSINSCAILTPSESAGRKIANQLSSLGLEANFMASKDLDLNKQGLKVITLKSAKGLEFPIVALAGFLDAPYPTIAKDTSTQELLEILSRERRTIYVAMTRAMRALLIIIPAKNPGVLLNNFDPLLWNFDNSSFLK